MKKLFAALPLVFSLGCTTSLVLGIEDGGSSTGAGNASNGTSSGTGGNGSSTATGVTSGASPTGTGTGASPTGGVIGQGVPAIDPVVGNVPSNYGTLVNPCELNLDFGSVAVGLDEEAVITVDNQGTGVLDIAVGTLGLPFSHILPPSDQIQAGSSVPIYTDFVPDNRGKVSSSFVIQTDGVNPNCPGPPGVSSTLTVNLTGTGTQKGILVVNPTSIDFGNTLVNTTATQSVLLTNTSSVEVDGITCVVGTANFSAAFSVNNCPATLPAGSSASVDLSFTPTSDDPYEVLVTFTGSDGETATLGLQGEEIDRALALENPGQIVFGYLAPGTSVVECLTVSNAANATFAVDRADLDFQDAGAFALSATDDATPPNPIVYPLTVPASGSAQVCYSFAPSVAQHQYAGQATLQTTDPSAGYPLIVGLYGWGGGPQITCTPPSIDFGPSPINDIKSVPVTCTNTGTNIPGITLTIGTPTTDNLNLFTASFDPTVNPYPAAGLAPGQGTQIDAIYLPTAVESDTATLLIPSNGGQGKGVSIPLSGQGTN